MKVLFLHGWHSVVGGVKPTALKEAGHEVVNPSLDDDDFEFAVRTAQREYELHRPDVIVGSSRGGAVAMNLEISNTPRVLLCPAWKKWGGAKRLQGNTVILHSRKDDVIPFEHSEELIRNSGLPWEALIEVGEDHRLADEASLAVMLWACQLLASGQTIPACDERSFAIGGESAEIDERGTQEEASYVCDACGEEIVIPIDVSEGATQTYVEDCPVCCRANKIHVLLDENGAIDVWAEPEQDRQ